MRRRARGEVVGLPLVRVPFVHSSGHTRARQSIKLRETSRRNLFADRDQRRSSQAGADRGPSMEGSSVRAADAGGIFLTACTVGRATSLDLVQIRSIPCRSTYTFPETAIPRKLIVKARRMMQISEVTANPQKSHLCAYFGFPAPFCLRFIRLPARSSASDYSTTTPPITRFMISTHRGRFLDVVFPSFVRILMIRLHHATTPEMGFQQIFYGIWLLARKSHVRTARSDKLIRPAQAWKRGHRQRT